MKKQTIDITNEHKKYCVCGHTAYDHELHYTPDSGGKGFYYGSCLEFTKDNTIGPPSFSICACKKFQLKS